MICFEILALSLFLSTAHSEYINCNIRTYLWEINGKTLEIKELKSENVNFSAEFEHCIPKIERISVDVAEVLPKSITVIDNNSDLKSQHNFETVESFLSYRGNFTRIERNNFDKMIKMCDLLLEYGKLETICSDSFEDLISLEYLYLNSNRIKFIHPNLFKMNSKLRRLNLEANLIEFLHPQTLWTLENLEVIDLDGNRLVYLEQSHFIKNPNLSILKAESNNIEYIEENTFDHLKLIIFDINWNSCANFFKDTFHKDLISMQFILNTSLFKAELIAKNCTLMTEKTVKKINQKIDGFKNYILSNNCDNEAKFDDFEFEF